MTTARTVLQLYLETQKGLGAISEEDAGLIWLLSIEVPEGVLLTFMETTIFSKAPFIDELKAMRAGKRRPGAYGI